jgi:hypothetical protein
MTGMGSNRFDDVQVEVGVDDVWWPGWLDRADWRRTREGRWECCARWTTGPAENRLGMFATDDIRPV